MPVRPNGSGESQRAAGDLEDLLLAGELEVATAESVLELDLVDLEIAPDEDGDEVLVGLEDQGLDEVRRRDPEKLGNLFDGPLVRRVELAGCVGTFERPGRRRFEGAGLGLLHVGAVVALGAREDRVFAGFGEHHELVRLGAADVAGVGLDLGVAQAAAGEDPPVGPLHGAVGEIEVLVVGVEGVGVLHQELAPPHEAESGSDLVAELGLDLVHVDGQLFVRGHGSADDVGDDLLVGRTEAELTVVPILDPQQFGAVLGPAPRILPQLGRLDRGHDQLGGSGAGHLLANDGRELGQRASRQGKVVVDSGRHLGDETGPHHQAVGDDLRIGGVLAKGVDEGLAPAHALLLVDLDPVSVARGPARGSTGDEHGSTARGRCRSRGPVRSSSVRGRRDREWPQRPLRRAAG